MFSLVVKNEQVHNKKTCCVLKLQMFKSETLPVIYTGT